MSEPHTNHHHRDKGPQVHRITEAQESHSVEQHSRVLKYTISMSVRLACFIAAFFVSGWLQWVFLAAAIVLPYIAVVIANGGADLSKREPVAEFYDPGDARLLTAGPSTTATSGEKAEGSPEAPNRTSPHAPMAHGEEESASLDEEGDIMPEPEIACGPSGDAATRPSVPAPHGDFPDGFPAEAPTTIDGSFVEGPQDRGEPAPGHGNRGGG